jgi:metallo-beta-lactamase family protein
MLTNATAISTRPTVTFWGAARTVTGSMHLVEYGKHKILLDCGLFRGARGEARQRNSRFPFHPTQVEAVILSHAHVDHCGNLPNLVRQGFGGPIFCTPATRDLLEVILPDSARIQEEEAHRTRVLGPHEKPGDLYSTFRYDAEQTLRQCVAVPYDRPTRVNPDVQALFVDAGHILGSAMVHLTVARPERDHTLTFTGDLGRRGLPFLHQPAPVPPADLLLCECTYGGRTHQSPADLAVAMQKIVRDTFGRGGKVLIPAFSLGRTQVVVHYLQQWMARGLLPRMPIYVDSPLADDIAQVYRRFPDHLDHAAFLNGDPDFLDNAVVHYVRTHDQSHELSLRTEPCLIVASGGMCEGGRIVRHLKRNLDDPRCTIVLVSYQAPTSLGRQLLEKTPTVRFHGRTWNKWAEVVELNGFSGHADQNDFLAILGPLAGEFGKVRLIHGELDAGETLAKALRAAGFGDVAVPLPGETVTL